MSSLQAAFLSALAGANVAEAAARAAVTALSNVDYDEADKNESERAWADAKSVVEKEEQEVDGAIREIAEVEVSNNVLLLPIKFYLYGYA